MAATEIQHLAYRDKFRSVFGEAFQSWFEELLRVLHAPGDFQAIRKTQGDGGLDCFVITSQRVYAVYAPSRIRELRDSETASKIRSDFATAFSTLRGHLKSWVFVHNHPQGELGQLGITAIADLKSQNPDIDISVLNIDGLWEMLKDSPSDTLERLFGERDSGSGVVSMRREESIPGDVKEELDRADKLDGEGKYAEARAAYESACKKAEAALHSRGLLKARIGLAEAIIHQNWEIDRARELLTECDSQLKETPDEQTKTSVRCLMADVEMAAGRIEEAKSLYLDALEVARGQKDRFYEGRLLIGLAHAGEMLGDLAEAHRLLDQAADIYRVECRASAGEDRRKATTNLGGCYAMKSDVYRHEGKLLDSLRCLNQAEGLLREASHPDNLARTLLAKAEACFAASKEEAGLAALNEARDVFTSVGNIHWLLRCNDLRIRLCFRAGHAQEALALCVHSVRLAAAFDSRSDHVDALLKMAALCREYEMDEPAGEFVKQARELAEKHQLTEDIVHCLVDEADGLQADDDKKRREALIRDAISRIEGLAEKSEVKGRRAGFLLQLGGLQRRLGDLVEAKRCFSAGLRLYEEIGDIGGIAGCLGALAAAAREEENPERAITLLEQLLQRSEGMPLHYFQAGAHHDLVSLMLLRGDIVAAREHVNACVVLCAKHPMPHIEVALKETRFRLELAERSRKPAASDLPTMLRELHAWKKRYPQVADAILAFWYHCFSTELWSNSRCQLGVKFLVRAASVQQFERFADHWSPLADLFIYPASFPLTYEAGIDILPWFDEILIPSHVRLVGFRGKAPSYEEVAEGFRAALQEIPYFMTAFDGSSDAFPDAKLFIVGRRYRVPDDIRQLMFDNSVEALISRRIIALPLRQAENDAALIHEMCVAHDGGLLPVFFGTLPSSGEVAQEREIRVLLPCSKEEQRTGNEIATAAKKSLRKFMSDIRANPDRALHELVEELESHGRDLDASAQGMPVRIVVLKFRAGPSDVVHPAFVLADA